MGLNQIEPRQIRKRPARWNRLGLLSWLLDCQRCAAYWIGTRQYETYLIPFVALEMQSILLGSRSLV